VRSAGGLDAVGYAAPPAFAHVSFVCLADARVFEV
jgi:hypothetical protein